MKQGEIWNASLDPIIGSEQAGFRPVLIISGNLMNNLAPVVVCCPLSTSIKNYKGNPILEPAKENGLKKKSEIMVIHMRSFSKDRLKKKLGEVQPSVVRMVKQTLDEILSY